jgi:hypothetical protein
MRRVLVLFAVAAAIAAVPAGAAASRITGCEGGFTVRGVSCSVADSVVLTWQESSADPWRAHFRLGAKWWNCTLSNKTVRLGQGYYPAGRYRTASCAGTGGRSIHGFLLSANFHWDSGLIDGCKPQPQLLDTFDFWGGSDQGYQLSIADLGATADIGCGYARRFYQSLYDNNDMRGSDGITTVRSGAYRWRCMTSGVAGVPQVENWSDVSTDCVGKSANSTLQQSMSLDAGALPGVICAAPNGNFLSLYGPCPYDGQHWDDTLLNTQASGDSGYQAAGLTIASAGSPGNTEFVPIVGAQNTYSLCVWQDAGQLTDPDTGETYEEYVCTYGGK